MAITKLGNQLLGLEKSADFMDYYVPGHVASKLNDPQKAALKKHYGLDDDADIGTRAFFRHNAGGALGAIPGVAVGMAGLMKKSPLLYGLGALGTVAGSLAGTNLANKKYSPENANRIMQQQGQGIV